MTTTFFSPAKEAFYVSPGLRARMVLLCLKKKEKREIEGVTVSLLVSNLFVLLPFPLYIYWIVIVTVF